MDEPLCMWGRLFRGEKSAYSEGRLIGMSNDCYLRPYVPTDLPAVRRLFKTTVEHINWRDYSAEQLGLKSIFETGFKRHSEPRLPSTAQINH